MSLSEAFIAPSSEMAVFLLTKPRPTIVGRVCQQKDFVCKRPQWGDGRVSGDFYGLCPMCWHAWNAWHGKYVTFRANPAAALLGSTSIETLRFLTGTELPEVGAERPDTFPEDWTTT